MPTSGRSWTETITVVPTLTPEALDALYGEVGAKLESDREFLGRTIVRRRRWSNVVKFIAWALFSLGVLLPILIVERGAGTWDRSGVELAMIAVVAGGLLLLADQLFNWSRSWQRLTLAELRVRHMRQLFALEWQKRRPFLTDAGMATEGVALIDLLIAATRDSNAVMLEQKQTWTNELDAALTDLRGRFDSQRTALEKKVEAEKEEAAKPTTGAINITIDRPGELVGELALLVDGKEARKWPAPDGALSVGNVPAGLRTVELRGTRKTPAGAGFIFAQAVNVAAGAAANFQVKA